MDTRVPIGYKALTRFCSHEGQKSGLVRDRKPGHIYRPDGYPGEGPPCYEAALQNIFDVVSVAWLGPSKPFAR